MGMNYQNGDRPERQHRIVVVGCGHVGAVSAACLAQLGHQVVGIDIDEHLLASLNRGEAPFFEPDLNELPASNLAVGRLTFTASYHQALAEAEFVFLCVNTPATPHGAADLTYVRQAVSASAEALSGLAAQPLLVTKSTSPIGTCETIEAILELTFPDPIDRLGIVANP